MRHRRSTRAPSRSTASLTGRSRSSTTRSPGESTATFLGGPGPLYLQLYFDEMRVDNALTGNQDVLMVYFAAHPPPSVRQTLGFIGLATVRTDARQGVRAQGGDGHAGRRLLDRVGVEAARPGDQGGEAGAGRHLGAVAALRRVHARRGGLAGRGGGAAAEEGGGPRDVPESAAGAPRARSGATRPGCAPANSTSTTRCRSTSTTRSSARGRRLTRNSWPSGAEV